MIAALYVSILLLVGMCVTPEPARAADVDLLHNEGVGTYTDPSVANQISNFSINRDMVSCGVGTVAGPAFTGPFAMLMYAKNVRFYQADFATHTITASGTMRSITVVGGATVEDVIHPFRAIAVDNESISADRFDVHFVTPFWKPGNPFCTPSTVIPGDCRFGGDLLLGEVTVDPASGEH